MPVRRFEQPRTQKDQPNDAEIMATAIDAFEAARSSPYRVGLPFGNESDADSEAWMFVDAIDDTLITLRSTPIDMGEADALSIDAYVARYRFSKAAHDAVREFDVP